MGAGLPACGEALVQEVGRVLRSATGRGRRGGGSRPGGAGTALPACSIWKADLLGHGRRDSNGDKKTFHIWTKSLERPRPAASLSHLPHPSASCPVSHWAPSPEPCPRSLTLGPREASWSPPLSHQATFCVARPGPWVLGKKQPMLGPELEIQRGAHRL